MNEPILGYRVLFDNDQGWSGPFLRNHAWTPGINIATCLLSGHQAPNIDCECGLYAYCDLEMAFELLGRWGWGAFHGAGWDNYVSPAIVMSVKGWGDEVLLHSDRWRARFAQPLAILQSSAFKGVDVIASNYFEVPLLNMEAFVAHSNEHATARYKNSIPFSVKRNGKAIKQIFALSFDECGERLLKCDEWLDCLDEGKELPDVELLSLWILEAESKSRLWVNIILYQDYLLAMRAVLGEERGALVRRGRKLLREGRNTEAWAGKYIELLPVNKSNLSLDLLA